MDVRKLLGSTKQNGRGVLVIGSGISGQAVARLFLQAGFAVTLTDRSGEDKLSEATRLSLAELEQRGAKIKLGIDGQQISNFLDNVGLALLSPGVSLESQIVGTLKRFNVPFIGELELALSLFKGDIVAVTGSNGKSTTVSLIQQIFQSAGVSSELCGNIGIAAISLLKPEDLINALQTNDKKYVVEVSSYQLESSQNIHPRIAIWLNLSDNHLERHGTLERYAACKEKLFKNQTTSDLAILNSDDAWSGRTHSNGKKLFFGAGSHRTNSAAISYDPKRGVDLIEINGLDHRYDLSSSRLIGLHNRYNIAASILAARELGVDKRSIERAICEFTPLEHRLEILNYPKHRAVINDSKSTTVASSLSAWRAITQQYGGGKVIMMIGGLAKAGSWDPLFSELAKDCAQLHSVICFGQDASLLQNHCKTHKIPNSKARSLEEATSMAKKLAQGEDVILLSPGCASFDEFRSFEERGRAFKEYVGRE